ncbi:DNA-directed RNA polymerase subunit delta [Mesomycoplasma ovipneumoniae]|uniref:DNA-directed RNA polymerase subunit delta n=1 Tax=Mesomycoplasma ovipneumoniae TaxID=29562 RepID=A0AAJ2UDM2_9BACT|nr:DNA-directed RNA polymerase subunit delta [Mesomycoplasma ovipneumoniae]MCP9306743.1 DNA-directed RNA polymerase subunit delta [Mesomycoplasma ovipneumoniae]MDW2829567.1 DNA-directed RNA polymerase subunit delta [Mesomycoplasma ovipneumoniae]MDW2833837.1 DNA-directed RNA polymerase subunit delta [Mesomycoplasma ovipneumoniae]MDW2834531.1 DNA-directed RNA polymerase subunit delta [Mesomycoplasma ovipneumoniae]MDW2835298.1 DNA-directed RNA polymerase subunit delta [Mesomycoplasma ovipneumonia
MKTIISIAINFLKNRESAHFSDIFLEVQIALMSKWENQLPNLSTDKILTLKRGELYKLLTIDGSFVALGNNYWALRSDILI